MFQNTLEQTIQNNLEHNTAQVNRDWLYSCPAQESTAVTEAAQWCLKLIAGVDMLVNMLITISVWHVKNERRKPAAEADGNTISI